MERVTSVEHVHQATGEVFTIPVEWVNGEFPLGTLPMRDGKSLCIDCDHWLTHDRDVAGHPAHDPECRHAKAPIVVDRSKLPIGKFTRIPA